MSDEIDIDPLMFIEWENNLRKLKITMCEIFYRFCTH